MRLAWAFFLRDARIALSYRVAFFVQFAGNFLLTAVLYFMGKTVGDGPLPALSRYGGDFLGFVLVGIALTDCVGVSLASFAAQIREAQTTGTLEATLLSPVRLPTILVLSSLWNYFLSAVRFLFYLVVGACMGGIDLLRGNVPSAALIFLLTVICFMGIGMMWAGVILLLKRGESVIATLALLLPLLSGVLFPTELLPEWAQRVASLIPLTHALEGMRFAILQGSTPWELRSVLLPLAGFGVVCLTAGVMGFNLAVRVAKRTGSLTQY